MGWRGKYDCMLDGVKYDIEKTIGGLFAMYERNKDGGWLHVPTGTIMSEDQVFPQNDHTRILFIREVREEADND